jgi:diguanylate cyclase (GGDEF)-like protein/PAS domain S-box-containing protein
LPLDNPGTFTMLDKSPHPVASRNYADHLFDMAAVIMLVLDANGCIERINPKGCEILGYRVEDILGMDWFEHFLPDNQRQETRRVFHRLVNGEEELIRHYDNSVMTSSGEIRHIEWHNALLRDTHGYITSVLSSGLDVTEQRRKRAILRMYERVVKNETDQIAVVDRDYIYRLVNQNYAQFHGRSREEFEGHSVADLFGNEMFDSTIKHRLDRCFAGEVVTFDDGVDIPGGDRRYRDVVYTPDYDDDGRVGTAIVCARDITDLHLSQVRLQESEARYKALFHGNSDAVYLYGLLPSGEPDRFAEVNEAACRRLGYSEAELLNLTPQDIEAGDVDKEHLVIQTLMTEGRAVFEMEHVARDGRIIPEEISASLIELQGRPMVLSIARDITERKRTLQTLKDSQEHTQMLLDSMAEGMYGVDTRGFCTFVNRSFLNLLGYEREEDLLGRHIHELIHHSHADGSPYPSEECRAYRAHVENHDCHVDDEVFWRRDGTSFPVEYWSHPMCRLGETVGSVVTFQNSSNRHQAEEKLQDARQMLQHVIDTVPNYVFWKDRDSRFLGCNEAFARLSGLQRPEEIIGMDDYALAWGEFAERYQRNDAEVISSGKPRLNIIEPMGMKDGTTGWLETSKVPLRDTQGQIIGVLGVFQDITARVYSEEKLRQTAKVFESTMEGVVITNSAGDIVAINPAFTNITGYSEAEALGKNPSIRQSGRHDKSFYQAMWTSILETGSWHGEIWNRRKTGETYPEWLTINTVKDEAGNTINYVAVFTDISQMKRSEGELSYLAHHDPLTELPNRLLLDARLEYAIQRADREGSSLAVLFLDLDRFKTVNDSLGHPIGDQLLKSVAALLGACVRGGDTVARLGGDEFVIVLEEVGNAGNTSEIAKKILLALNKRYDLDGQAVYVSASIGISTYPADGRDGTTLLKNADAAMYLAKEEGRNTFRFYSTELTRTAHDRLNLESELRRAIEKQEFLLHFQPQVDVSSGAIVGAEALVRWQHPQFGIISPLRFIPLAEETGLILPLGEWVLNAACEQLSAWMESDLPPITLAVNLSPRQFLQSDLIRQLRAVLDATGLPPWLLELEITEGAIMKRGQEAVATLQAVKDLGLKLAIDDFGTGYSSLAYLRRFPIDTLKIDQSFMRDIPRDTGAMEIAVTITAMAHNLRMQVLAEGVETSEQLAFLQRNGCNTYQGYLYSRPVTAESFASLLRTSLSTRQQRDLLIS